MLQGCPAVLHVLYIVPVQVWKGVPAPAKRAAPAGPCHDCTGVADVPSHGRVAGGVCRSASSVGGAVLGCARHGTLHILPSLARGKMKQRPAQARGVSWCCLSQCYEEGWHACGFQARSLMCQASTWG